MTLAAAILLFGISTLTSMDSGRIAQSTAQSDSSAKTQPTQVQSPPPQTEQAAKPSSAKPAATPTPAGKPKVPAAQKGHRKKKPEPPCDPAPASPNSPGSDPATPPAQPGGAQAPSTSEASKKCPPAKTVVKQGGITEQSIQLAGGSGAGTTQQMQSTHQMLAETEENLKKAAASQLSVEQQNLVAQIRQFVTQSKSFLASADYERAHTLAWKAKVLSDDLVNPKQ